MSDTLLTFLFTGLLLVAVVAIYLRNLRIREAKARAAAEKGQLYSDGPRAQHPHIDVSHCIGCHSCTLVCPEGDVLGMIGGKAAIVNPHRCVGHSLCAEACPVGAITMVTAGPGLSAELPYLTPEYETSVPNLFIAGELGGLALIRNAVNQGRDSIDTIAARLSATERGGGNTGVFDVLIAGAGPAGLAASLRAIERNLSCVTLERDQVGGAIAKYPRQKLVMTSPVEFPLYGKFKHTELSKEALLAFWEKVLQRAGLNVHTGVQVEDVQRGADGVFTTSTRTGEQPGQYRSRAVVLALGRAGIPRKLGLPGEELPKVMYRLIEADHYVNQRILVVGGGDSAVEAAIGLARQPGNQVTLSYRKGGFVRIKERNATRIAECIRNGSVCVLFDSTPVEIRPDSVVLDVQGERRDIPNDFVWVFAGGTPPNDFLRKIGVQFGTHDITAEAALAAREGASRG